MLIYFMLLALIVLPAFLIRPQNHIDIRSRGYTVLIGVALFIVSACRDITVGVDTQQFCDAYQRIGSEGANAFEIERYEPLFILLCLGLNQLSSNYQLLIIVASAISLIPIARMIYKMSNDIPMSFFLYVTMNFYFSSMNTMRQSMAIGVIALAIPGLIQKGKKFPFIVSVLVAFLLHKSALVALILVPLSKTRFSKKWAAIYMLCAVMFFIFTDTLVNFITGLLGLEIFYDEAFMGANYFGAVIMTFVVAVVVVVCMFIFKMSRSSRQAGLNDSIFQHALMLWFIFNLLFVKVQIIGRFGDYFSLFAMIALPLAFSRLPAAEKVLARYMACAAFLIYFTIIGVARPEWYGVIPYTVDLENCLSMF